MEVSGQLCAPAASPPGKQLRVTHAQEGDVDMVLKIKIAAPARN
jgi:hypothetical protein